MLKTKDYGYVGMQLMLFVAYIFPVYWSDPHHALITQIGFIISIVGGLVLLLSLAQLNTYLSPFPTPKKETKLIQNGLYKYIRHPIYTGILLLFFGYGLYQSSSYKLCITILLAVLFYFKSIYEEKCMEEKFAEYKNYRDKTGRFFPKFF